MAQAVGVAQFMDSFLDSPLLEKGLVFWETVEALAQASQGYHRCWPAHVGLSEDEVQPRSVKVQSTTPSHLSAGSFKRRSRARMLSDRYCPRRRS